MSHKVIMRAIYTIAVLSTITIVSFGINMTNKSVSDQIRITSQTNINADEPRRVLEQPSPKTTIATTTAEPEVDQNDLELLACVIYQEAGGDACCDDCRRRVADVVLNRVEDDRFPDTIEEVLTAKRQYGRFYWTGVVWPSRASQDAEKEAVDRAYRIAEEVLRGQHSELYGEGYVWQAEFKQGKGIVECCGIYFGR